jgi:hypothetical protein
MPARDAGVCRVALNVMKRGMRRNDLDNPATGRRVAV